MSKLDAIAVRHVALFVPDLDRALAFYVDVIGFELVRRYAWANSSVIDAAMGVENSSGQIAMISLREFGIELFQYHSPAPTEPGEPRAAEYGWTHICLQVEDAQAAVAVLAKVGVQVHAAPADTGNGPDAYARDPFGNIFEIWESAA